MPYYTLTNKYNLPRVLVNAIANDPYDPGRPKDCDKYITATSLNRPPQLNRLMSMLSEQVYRGERSPVEEDVADKLFALYGSAGHHIIERGADENMINERRLYAEHNGWTIGGQLDVLETDTGHLYDSKFTGVYKVTGELSADYVNQMNTLTWLCRQNGLEVNKAFIIGFIRDHMAARAEVDPSYPQIACKVLEVPIWPEANYLNWLTTRLHDLESDPVRPCTDAERWARKKFAVMKKGNKKATKVFESESEAEDFVANHKDKKKMSVVDRGGKHIRCERYCPVAAVCKQYHEEKLDF